jgi:hypothetical protein
MVIFALLPPISDPIQYHDFADKRVFLGIQHAGDVLSNIPLFIFGIWGILLTRNSLSNTSKEERGLWSFFFFCITLTAIFSAYYHLQPNFLRLSLDRFALILAFMSFFSLMLAECLGKKMGLILFPFLILLGLASVCFWMVTERQGHGDLKPYVFAQLIAIVLMMALFLLYPSKHPKKGFLYSAIVLYLVAKLCELSDWNIYLFLDRTLSGHNLKHLFSSVGILCIVLYLRCRKTNSLRKY